MSASTQDEIKEMTDEQVNAWLEKVKPYRQDVYNYLKMYSTRRQLCVYLANQIGDGDIRDYLRLRTINIQPNNTDVLDELKALFNSFTSNEIKGGQPVRVDDNKINDDYHFGELLRQPNLDIIWSSPVPQHVEIEEPSFSGHKSVDSNVSKTMIQNPLVCIIGVGKFDYNLGVQVIFQERAPHVETAQSAQSAQSAQHAQIIPTIDQTIQNGQNDNDILPNLPGADDPAKSVKSTSKSSTKSESSGVSPLPPIDLKTIKKDYANIIRAFAERLNYNVFYRTSDNDKYSLKNDKSVFVNQYRMDKYYRGDFKLYWTKECIDKYIQDVIKLINTLHPDGLIIFLGGHGDMEGLLDSNKQIYPFDDIFNKFPNDPATFPALAEIPKIIITDICRDHVPPELQTVGGGLGGSLGGGIGGGIGGGPGGQVEQKQDIGTGAGTGAGGSDDSLIEDVTNDCFHFLHGTTEGNKTAGSFSLIAQAVDDIIFHLTKHEHDNTEVVYRNSKIENLSLKYVSDMIRDHVKKLVQLKRQDKQTVEIKNNISGQIFLKYRLPVSIQSKEAMEIVKKFENTKDDSYNIDNASMNAGHRSLSRLSRLSSLSSHKNDQDGN